MLRNDRGAFFRLRGSRPQSARAAFQRVRGSLPRAVSLPCGPIRAPVSGGKICSPDIPQFQHRGLGGEERGALPLFLTPNRRIRGCCGIIKLQILPGAMPAAAGKARCAFGYFYRTIKVARSRWSGTSPIKKNLKTVCFKFHPRPNNYI